MKTITPHLWFDKEAKEAVDFYVSAFPRSRVTHRSTLSGVPTPSGDCDILAFELSGQPFMAINAGPLFKPNPSISFIVNFDRSREKGARKRLDTLWKKLSEGGKVLMPLDKYPFSERYGWVQDRFGFSWQLILSDPKGEPRPDIVPSLLFTGDVAGRAEGAVDYYVSVFTGRRGVTARYGTEHAPNKAGTLMFADFALNGQWFAAMDSARTHGFGFNEAVSLLIPCESQKEIDALTPKLSAVPEAEQCGWTKDRFGVSWQLHPVALDELLTTGAPEQIQAVTQAFLGMKRFDIAALTKAHEGARPAAAADGGRKRA
jgi:predicted 3-demethylubiquinone-9 3-methyltransferase (glyoxalase superfamily)